MEQIDHYMKRYGLDEVLPSAVRPQLKLIRYATGEAICTQGAKAEQLHFLVSGKIRVAHTSAAGKRLVLSFKYPLDLIGDIEYVRRTPFLNTVEAVTPVEMIVVRFDELARHAKEDVTWLHYLLEGITKKFERKSQSMSFNLFYPVDVRLASYLLSMTPEETTLGSTVDELTDIADLIGTSYRHVNRTLKRFVEQGLIERNRRSIAIIDRAGLIAVAGESIYE